MFTGIIEEVGTVHLLERRGSGSRIAINAKKVLEDAEIGDSICVNGVCLTVASLSTDSFLADIMPETISRTSFARLRPGSLVNLEPALRVGARLGGHIVSGHVDGVGIISSMSQDSDAVRMSVQADVQIMAGIVEKGSVALEGISLTVSDVQPGAFEVSLIPHTFAHTNLVAKRIGDMVNIEDDILGKYVFRALEGRVNAHNAAEGCGLTEGKLSEYGF